MSFFDDLRSTNMFARMNNAVFQIQIYLAAVGFISCFIILCFITSKLYRAIRVFVLPRIVPLDYTAYGEWAVIKGGSSGIGRSYANRLASNGMNIVIISNELEALKLTADEIESHYNVQCRYICADFTKEINVFDKVMLELNGKDVGVLVNAAGIAGNTPCRFLKETEKNALAMVDLHIRAVVIMTLKILPSMLKKNKCAIVNISSMSSLFPMKYFSIYSPCKAFSDRFTRGLYWEYCDNYKNVCLQSLIPFFVLTRMIKEPIIRKMAMDCDKFTDSAVGTIGTTYHTSGHWIHELLWFLFSSFPTIIQKKIIQLL